MVEPVAFDGGAQGEWRVEAMTTLAGEPLAPVERLHVRTASRDLAADARWTIQGVPSNMRYATRRELDALALVQPVLGRSNCTSAALIPIRKSAAWWMLAQDERRSIFEEDSRHNAIGMQYLPGVARRLLHARDLGGMFDFLTWFEFDEGMEASFDQLVSELRRTREWSYVDREIDIRLKKDRA